jgi:hypothetical protein
MPDRILRVPELRRASACAAHAAKEHISPDPRVVVSYRAMVQSSKEETVEYEKATPEFLLKRRKSLWEPNLPEQSPMAPRASGRDGSVIVRLIYIRLEASTSIRVRSTIHDKLGAQPE